MIVDSDGGSAGKGGKSSDGGSTGGSTEGGQDSNGSGGSAAGAKAEFVAEADAVCVAGNARQEKELQDFIKGGVQNLAKGDGPAEIVEEVLAPGVERQIEEVEAVGVPAGDRAEVEAIFAAMRDGVELARSNPRKYIAGNPFAASERLARRYGFRACGGLA